jgi:hypothetical protein
MELPKRICWSSFLGLTLGSALGNFLVGFVANANYAPVDRFVVNKWEERGAFRNHDLAKAVRKASLQAQGAIICEFAEERKTMAQLPPQQREWVRERCRMIKEDLAHLDKQDFVAPPLTLLPELLPLVGPTGASDMGTVDAVRDQLVKVAISGDDVPSVIHQRLQAELYQLTSVP